MGGQEDAEVQSAGRGPGRRAPATPTCGGSPRCAGIIKDMRGLQANESTVHACQWDGLQVSIAAARPARILESEKLIPAQPFLVTAERACQPRTPACEEVEDGRLVAHRCEPYPDPLQTVTARRQEYETRARRRARRPD